MTFTPANRVCVRLIRPIYATMYRPRGSRHSSAGLSSALVWPSFWTMCTHVGDGGYRLSWFQAKNINFLTLCKRDCQVSSLSLRHPAIHEARDCRGVTVTSEPPPCSLPPIEMLSILSLPFFLSRSLRRVNSRTHLTGRRSALRQRLFPLAKRIYRRRHRIVT